jgi:hypothetical protein
MADIPSITGTIGTENFQFFIDGVATYKQTERLIGKIDALVKRFKAEKFENRELEKQRQNEAELLKAANDLRRDNNDAIEDNTQLVSKLHQATSVLDGGFRGLLRPLEYTSARLVALGGVVGSMVGIVQNLFDYSDQLGAAMQRGVAGGVMDFAIAAKTGGISLAQFNKALESSGGAFALIGSNATDGAKNFGALISQVRSATASVGNLGLSNEQQAEFVAQQLKVAVAQGMKGKQAQDFVVKNARNLGKELDDLASRTGRSVLEMAQAAMKVAQDPIVSSFVRSAGAMGADVAQATQKLAANLAGLFGPEQGGKIAEDALKAALSGLPFQITQTGNALIGLANGTYNEIERQAKMAKAGMEITEADRQRLRDTIKREVAERGQMLRYIAMGSGPQAESAKQLLALAQAAEQYNEKDAKTQKKRDEVAKKFMEESNKLRANFQELAVPFLQLINGIDWAFMFKVLNSFVETVQFLLTPLNYLGKLLGDTGAGTLIGGFLALVTVLGTSALVFKNLSYVIKPLIEAFKLIPGLFKIRGGLGTARTIAAETAAGKTTGGKLKDAILGGADGKYTAINIAAGAGTMPTNPLFVAMVGGFGGAPGRGGKGAPGSGLPPGAPGTGPAGPADRSRYGRADRIRQIERDNPGMSRREAIEQYRRQNVEEVGRRAGEATRGVWDKTKTFFSKWGGLLGGLTLGIGGSVLASKGAERLNEDENDTVGKVMQTTGEVMENLGLWGGLLLQFMPGLTDKLKSFGSTVWDTTKSIGSKALPAIKDFGKSLLPAADDLAKGSLKKLPLIGGALSGVFEYFESGNLGRSIASGLGSALGGVGGGILGSFLGPAGTVAGGVAGGVAGEKLFTSLYDWIFGSGDKKAQIKEPSASEKLRSSPTPLTTDDWVKVFANPADYQKMSGTLPATQSSVIDQEKMTKTEEKTLTSKMVTLLEDIKLVNETSAGIQAKGVSVADSSNRYLRDQRIYGNT